MEMFEKTLVGVDDRQGGRDALALAATLTRVGGGAELIAVRAYPRGPQPSRVSVAPDQDDLRGEAGAELERVIEDSGVNARTVVVGDTSPARALHLVAEDEGADLLVVGSTHRGEIGRVLVGGVTAGVLHHAPCAVAVAPVGYAERGSGLATIGVGFDGGEEAREALRLAGELAKAAGAQVRVLLVVASPIESTSAASFEPEWIESAQQAGGEELNEAIGTFQGLGVQASGDVTVGTPVEELTALSGDVDLVVVGSRGWGPVRRLLVGSTSDQLVREAACPVIAVPRPDAA
jgi:nucleotide-binding universal stress UspA family protein